LRQLDFDYLERETFGYWTFVQCRDGAGINVCRQL